jgi:hypothetical protein
MCCKVRRILIVRADIQVQGQNTETIYAPTWGVR